jgi:hypothetical protein
MVGLRVVLVALLCTLATVGGIALGATQDGSELSIQTVENGSNYLGPNASDVDRSGQASTSFDVGATVRANAGDVRSTVLDASVKRKYESAATATQRQRVVKAETEGLAREVNALERREQRTLDEYAAGELGERDLFRTLAIIDGEADTLAGTVAWLETRANEINDSNNGLRMTDELRRLSALRIRLQALCGPVRTKATRGMNGSSTNRIHAEVADGGLVLATVDRTRDGGYTYTREAYTPAIRTRQRTDRYDGRFGEVFARLGEIYPWVIDHPPRVANSNRIGRGEGGARLYSVDLNYGQSRLTPYLDGGSGRVVKEQQRRRVEAMPTERRTATSDTSGLNVTVRTTYASGPLGVNATNPSRNRTVDATVYLNGDSVGRTDQGTFWTVAPRGAANVTVVHGNTTVTTTVRAS